MIVTVTVSGLAATSVVPAGRLAVTGTWWTPAVRPATSRSITRVAPSKPIEVGRRAADRDQDAIGAERVGEVAPRADEPEAGADTSEWRSPGGA